MGKTPHVSLVVPVLDDAVAVARLLPRVPATLSVEVLLVDGGFDARLDDLVFRRPDVRLIRTRPGRGHQMNAGAMAASGDWLLFLHADSQLPDGWLDQIQALPADTLGGWFRFGLDDAAWQARLLERAVAWRTRLFTLPYGDQGLFVRRPTFEALGGYPEWPLMEDVDLVRRLVHAGPVREIPLRLTTSARRWRRDGWLRRSARNLMLLGLYFAGVSPARLARWY